MYQYIRRYTTLELSSIETGTSVSVMARPRKSPRPPLAYVSARLSDLERAQLEAVARATDRTPSSVVRRAIRFYTSHLEIAESLLRREAGVQADAAASRKAEAA